MLNVKNLAALILCSCWSVCEHKDVCISIDNSCVFTVVLINAPLLNLYVFLCPADAKCNLSKSNYLWSPQTCLLACFPFSFPPPHTYIINIWEAGCLGGGGGFNICPIWNVSGPSSGRHAVDKAPNRFVWDVRLYYGCLFYLLAPTRTQLPLNVYSRRIGLLIQVSRTLWKMKVTDSVSPGFRVAL